MLKKLGIVLLVTLCMLPVSAMTVKVGSDVIENDETGIPDKRLYREILKSLKKKKDEKFTRKEAERIENLYLWFENCDVSFRGIGCLKNLKKLDCFGIDTGELEEIAAELPHLKRLLINCYDVENIENRKTIDSLESLKNMKNLVYLDVSYNNLTSLNGTGGMAKLKTLKAVSNQIADTEQAKGLKSLKELYLSGNQLTNLNGINNLKKLTYLDASNNNLTSLGGIGKLEKLEKLKLSGNHLSNVKGIKKLKNLKELYLDDNNMKKIGEIGQIKNLTKLYMNGNQMTGVKGIGKLKNLQLLSLNDNCLTKLGEITQLKKLEYLYLSKNKIKTLSDSDLKSLKKLRSLNLYDNELKELPGKKSLKKLKSVDFNWNYLTEEEIKKKLKKVYWEGHSLCRWTWEEQKTGIQVTYLSPDQKTGITKDTKEIVGKITPGTIKGYSPDFYLLLPDGKMYGWDGKNYNASAADENGVFRIDGLDLREYAGKEVKLILMLDYAWKINIDRFVVQE